MKLIYLSAQWESRVAKMTGEFFYVPVQVNELLRARGKFVYMNALRWRFQRRKCF